VYSLNLHHYIPAAPSHQWHSIQQRMHWSVGIYLQHDCKDFRNIIQLQYIQGFQIVTFVNCNMLLLGATTCSLTEWKAEVQKLPSTTEFSNKANLHEDIKGNCVLRNKINGAVQEHNNDRLKVNVWCTSPPTLCNHTHTGQTMWWHYFCQHKLLQLHVDTIKSVESFAACNKAVKKSDCWVIVCHVQAHYCYICVYGISRK
jgi:hypothetical protein